MEFEKKYVIEISKRKYVVIVFYVIYLCKVAYKYIYENKYLSDELKTAYKIFDCK